MNQIFRSSEINRMVLSNRFIRSATWEGMATEDGAVTPKLIETMVDLARGDVGLIISGHAYVQPRGQASLKQLGVYKDEFIDGLRQMTDAVHQYNGKIVMQISHAGNFAPMALTGQTPVVVSDYEGLAKSPRHELSGQEIEQLVDNFADAAGRAKAAGFDGVQIHAAHGYLLSQFLSPIFNRRRDQYGGDIQNRARVLLEVYHAIRRTVGDNYPILVKLNCRDFADNGLSLEDSLQAGHMLAEAGIDAIEISGGLLNGGKMNPSRPGVNPPDQEAYYREEARAFKKEIRIPIILVGGIRSFEVAESLVEEEVADYISLSRPLIREPHLINRWKSGDRSKVDCNSDNSCFKPGRKGQGIACRYNSVEN